MRADARVKPGSITGFRGLAFPKLLRTLAFVLLVLRVIGTFNAVVWLGGAVFFTFGIVPAVFSEEMKRIFGDYYSGVIAQQLIARLFTLHLICGSIALIHFFAEMFYMGRPFRRITFALIVIVLGFGVLGGAVLQPKLKSLHQVKYSRASTEEAQTAAKRRFGLLHGLSQVGNVITLIILIAYTWREVQRKAGK